MFTFRALVDICIVKYQLKVFGKLYRVRQITFFWKMLWKNTEYFLKFRFLFESTILPVKNGKQFHSNGKSARIFDKPCNVLNINAVKLTRIGQSNNVYLHLASDGHWQRKWITVFSSSAALYLRHYILICKLAHCERDDLTNQLQVTGWCSFYQLRNKWA